MFVFRVLLFVSVIYGKLTGVLSQTTSLQVCERENNENTECILHHVSDRFYQLMQHITTKIDSIPTCTYESEPRNYLDISPDAALVDVSLPENCIDVLSLGYSDTGVYTIYEPITKVRSSLFRTSIRRAINVYCDMSSENGGPGWIVFQRRQDGSVNFTQLWDEYRDGFGDPNGEFWLGNDNLAIITGGEKSYELRIELGDWDNQRRFARYSSFRVLGEDLNFKLLLGSFTAGDAGDSMSYVNGRLFSTIDRDNGVCCHHCAFSYYRAGFWYNQCGHAYLNNPYRYDSDTEDYKGISWFDWRGNGHSLKFVEMKIRPTGD